MISRHPLQNDLEPLLLSADLSPAAVEVLLNLALGPAREADLALNTKLLAHESVSDCLAEIKGRGLLSREPLSDGRIELAGPRAFQRALGPVAGARLALLVRRVRKDCLGGLSLNPGLRPRPSLGALFAERLPRLAARLPQVEIKLQTVCNLRCRYCFIRRSAADSLDHDSARGMLVRARSSGCTQLILTGGEPTLRKDLPALIAGARELGFKDVQLFTNGLMFAYRDLVDACVKAGLTSLVLHVSTFDPEIYRRLTGRDLVPKVRAAMANLARHPSLSIEVISVINRWTVSGMPDTVRTTREWQRRAGFAWFANQLPFCCVYSSSWDHRKEILLPMEDSLASVRRIIESEGGSPWPLLFLGYPLCLMYGQEAHVFDLYITLARFFLSRRQIDHTFLDTMFQKPAACLRCRHEKYCVGLSRGYARIYGTSLLSPVGMEP